jgi:anti-anti-sigma factor
MAPFPTATRAAFIRQAEADIEFIRVFGEVDIESDDDLRATIREAATSSKHVVVDLTPCTYIGSQGFAVLAGATSLTDLAVIAPPKVKRLMELIGLSSLLVESESL